MVFKRQAEDYKLVATKTTTSARQNQRAHLSATLTKRFLGKWGMSNVLNPNEIEIDERRTEIPSWVKKGSNDRNVPRGRSFRARLHKVSERMQQKMHMSSCPVSNNITVCS